MDGICSNPADTSLSGFFRQKEENKEVDEGEGESDEASVNGDGSRIDKEDDNNPKITGHILKNLKTVSIFNDII